MSKLIDITGNKYNMLTVLGRVENDKNGQSRWECICECGNKTIVKGANLKNGAVKSCGCLVHRPALNKKHGESNTPLYRMWTSMIYRCDNPKYIAYKYYGARGIRVCDEWHDYETFKKWVNETKTDDSYTIERIDVNGDYGPDNCKWIPMSEQANNRRSNIVIDYNGEEHTLMQWCKKLNLNYKNVHNRMYKLGWSFEKAISTDIDISKRNKVERKKNGRILKQ